MLSVIVSQTATEVPPAQVVEKAAQVIDAFNNLGVFMAVLGVIALFAIVVLVLVWSNRKTGQTAIDVLALTNADKIKELQESREDRRAEIARQQQNHDQFMAALTILAGKQADLTTGLNASEARVTQKVATSEATVKARVETVGAANIARLDKIDKALAVIQTTINVYSDPSAAAKYDRVLEIFKAQLDDISEDITAIRADVATNTEVGTANTTAITDAADALAAGTPPAPPDAPAEVVVADISPQAVASIMDAVAKPAADDSEELPKASGL